MTDIIYRQNVSKRKSGSTLAFPAKHRWDNTGLGNAKRNFMDGRKKVITKTALLSTFSNKKARRKKKTSSAAGIKKQNIKIRNNYKVLVKNLLKKKAAQLTFKNTKAMLLSLSVTAAVLISAFYVNAYIQERNMFSEFMLSEDLNIDNVLYESLPEDYSGQGSGDIKGIEPVLLTSGEPITYKVKPGDTLSEISKSNNVKIGTLISFNKITDVRRLQVGMELKIPEYDGVPYEVKKGDSLSSISKSHNISINSILDANNLETDVLQPGEILFIPGAVMNEFDYKKAMGTLFVYPTRGRLSSSFGYRPDPFTGQTRFHNGIDIANSTGTAVLATMSGRVADVGDRPSGYGKYVIIKHANGYQSLYGHLNRINVREGEYIYQSQKVGEMGNTGRSTGPHLHFSIYKNNTPVNPSTYLW